MDLPQGMAGSFLLGTGEPLELVVALNLLPHRYRDRSGSVQDVLVQ
ncbi:hypothetical protein HNR07_002584 [Nocardiopsis metallicus]|uniref:Uncharacterized protein n=1 Tax=Nocardiopsis metallicus TaxID=179819 RepID=A0A840WID3_9ACTN|nr:hypothetical protein [Nocardiopsis metallicus]